MFGHQKSDIKNNNNTTLDRNNWTYKDNHDNRSGQLYLNKINSFYRHTLKSQCQHIG